MLLSLLISVRLHEGLYHGANESEPSPSRLFQALVAGVGISGPLQQPDIDALIWLEKKSESVPPVIGLPRMRRGQEVVNFVPNNDLDAKQGDRRNMGAIRTKKRIQPLLFNTSTPFLYCWEIEAQDTSNAQHICAIAEHLFQFGRGVDFAWATAEILERQEALTVFSDFEGKVLHPTPGGRGTIIACPFRGSLQSLSNRHAAFAKRFETVVKGRSIGQHFRQPPKARFLQVSYGSPPSRQLFELRQQTAKSQYATWPQSNVVRLVETLRDVAVNRLKDSLPELSRQIDLYLVGRIDESDEKVSSADRVRIIPILSIGTTYVDRNIRRILVEVPSACPLRPADIFWAFSGLPLVDLAQPEYPVSVVRAEDTSMLNHYGIGDSHESKIWRSVTPIALPESARRRRIDPKRLQEDAKSGSERKREQLVAAAAIMQALRHAKIDTEVIGLTLQREPFDRTSERAEMFAPETRFPKERLWHVEIEFAKTLNGPIVIGDGRFLGLGLLAPK